MGKCKSLMKKAGSEKKKTEKVVFGRSERRLGIHSTLEQN